MISSHRAIGRRVRVTCPECGQLVSVRSSGYFWHHFKDGVGTCPGTFLKAKCKCPMCFRQVHVRNSLTAPHHFNGVPCSGSYMSPRTHATSQDILNMQRPRNATMLQGTPPPYDPALTRATSTTPSPRACARDATADLLDNSPVVLGDQDTRTGLAEAIIARLDELGLAVLPVTKMRATIDAYLSSPATSEATRAVLIEIETYLR